MNTNEVDKISNRETITYSLGGLGKNIAYMMVCSYSLYFYQTVLGVSASFVGAMLMAARIFDAFNDPIMGAIVSKTKSRWGRYKPWILSGAILNSLVIIAMFNLPPNMGPTGTKFYITITYILCGITYTISDIPYWAVIASATQPGKVRERLSQIVRIFSGIGSGIATALSMFFVHLIGGKEVIGEAVVYNEKLGFSRVSIIVAIVYTALTILTVLNLPKEKYPEDANLSVKQIFSTLFKNDQALVVAAIIISFLAAVSITQIMSQYIFYNDYAGTEITLPFMGTKFFSGKQLHTVYMVILAGAQFLSMTVIYPVSRKKFGNRTIFIAATVLLLVGNAIMFGLGFAKNLNFWGLVLPCCLIGFGLGIAYVLTTILITNAVNYGEAKTGIRQNSIVSSIQTLMSKFATSISVLITGIGLDIVKYAEEGAVQMQDTLLKGRILFTAPPLVFGIIILILLIKRKDL